MDHSLDIMIRDIPLRNSIEIKNHLRELLLKYTNDLLFHKDFLIKTCPFLSSYFFLENIKRIQAMEIGISYSAKENEEEPFSLFSFHKVFKIVEKPVHWIKTTPLNIPTTTILTLLQSVAKQMIIDIILSQSYHQVFIDKLRIVYDRKTKDVRFQVFYYFLRADHNFPYRI